MVKQVEPGGLDNWRKDNPDHLLIDVREDYEFEEFNIGGINVPMDHVIDHLSENKINSNLLFCCKTGKRSAAIAHVVKRKLNLNEVYTLAGGVDEYKPSNL